MKKARFGVIIAFIVAIIAFLWMMSDGGAPTDSPRASARGCFGGDRNEPRIGSPSPTTGTTAGAPTTSNTTAGEGGEGGYTEALDGLGAAGEGAKKDDWTRNDGWAALGGEPQGKLAIYDSALPLFNPLFRRNMADLRAQALVFDRLFYRSSITNEIKSRLVERHELDGNRIILELTPDIRWHDGQAFTAEDVCFTVRAILDPNTETNLDESIRRSLVGCSVDGDLKAVVTLNGTFHNVLERLSFAIVPEHAFNTSYIPRDHEFSSRPIGTGSMRGSLGKRSAFFKAFPNPHHQPQIAELVIHEGGDPLVQLRTLMLKGAQGMVIVPPFLWQEIDSTDSIVARSYDTRSVWYVAINTQKSRLSNRAVRQALQYALDRPALVTLSLGIDADDQGSPVVFVSGPLMPNSNYYNRAVALPIRSLTDVARKMEEAGFQKQGGRWVDAAGPISLKLGMEASLDIEMGHLLNQVGNQLQEAGFDSQVYKIAPDDFHNLEQKGTNDYDLIIGKWSYDTIEDVQAMFHTRQDGWGSRNIFSYSNPEVDVLLETFSTTSSSHEAQEAYQELHQIVARELPHLYLWRLGTKSAFDASVSPVLISPHTFFEEFDHWRVE